MLFGSGATSVDSVILGIGHVGRVEIHAGCCVGDAGLDISSSISLVRLIFSFLACSCVAVSVCCWLACSVFVVSSCCCIGSIGCCGSEVEVCSLICGFDGCVVVAAGATSIMSTSMSSPGDVGDLMSQSIHPVEAQIASPY